jgi:Fur family transcriptional regulator, ferric uptake regulator
VDLGAELRAQGYRVTPQRQLVLEAVTTLGHATPEEIAASVQQKASGVNLSTVYRTLDLLEELGLVTHTHLGHGAPTYHSALDAERLAVDLGFQADVRHLAVFGVCRSCQH